MALASGPAPGAWGHPGEPGPRAEAASDARCPSASPSKASSVWGAVGTSGDLGQVDTEVMPPCTRSQRNAIRVTVPLRRQVRGQPVQCAASRGGCPFSAQRPRWTVVTRLQKVVQPPDTCGLCPTRQPTRRPESGCLPVTQAAAQGPRVQGEPGGSSEVREDRQPTRLAPLPPERPRGITGAMLFPELCVGRAGLWGPSALNPLASGRKGVALQGSRCPPRSPSPQNPPPPQGPSTSPGPTGLQLLLGQNVLTGPACPQRRLCLRGDRTRALGLGAHVSV